jgi:hypothetical protein
MRTFVRCIALPVVVVLSAAVPAGSGDATVERERDATQVAMAWFTSLMQGETAVTTSLSAVPFSFDKKEEVKTYADLKKLYDQIVAKKGKRNLKPESVRIESSSSEKVEVVLMVGGEGILIVVRPGEAFRVVGFSD